MKHTRSLVVLASLLVLWGGWWRPSPARAGWGEARAGEGAEGGLAAEAKAALAQTSGLPLWSEGIYFPLLFSREKIEAAATERLVLEPAADGKKR